ncbi:PREDICTED: zygotic DNA replication licensing factor mcm3-like [Priapulus caudatus]|uniref:DNA replication licensing factor MCM3 n=1 Tax=Priapulus caudatus TaxID=37621 RepID=A0ABM1E0Y0_PRICU|nr:PREDICTED: zygotic DNA replication licensing factor mcm3-like [Priapulus caudatus]
MMDVLDVDIDQHLREWQRDYLDFLDDDEDQGIYQQKVRNMIANGEFRLIVNINEMRRKKPRRAKGILDNSFEELIAFGRALKEFVEAADTTYSKMHEDFFIGFEGRDEDNNPLETEYGLCMYKDHQTLTIQEMPEKAPAGQLPRSVDIVLDNDLVDKVKPGDRVQVVGTYRCLPGKQGGYTSGSFRTIMIANNIQQLSKEIAPIFSAEDIGKIKTFSKQKEDVFEILGKSLAPTIHGHEYIKKAILYMLLGGVEKVLPNGSRLRGDINILLIGDPSVAKSQLLRYVLHTAPRAIATTGRGSSGVGLTAAVTTDQETGERRLEAGAMVLADRGVVCIDEFDKMSDIDRTAIHEVMEQGRVTIAKAGIHASLNARCSVLAAANPVYGRYDQYKTPMENIGLQDSLLSRFDCLFIMLDMMDPESDRKISDHVLRIHRYRGANEQDGDVLEMGGVADLLTTQDLDAEGEEDEDTPVYEKYDAMLHGKSRSRRDRIVTMKFMRKYIHVAKTIKPVLSNEASHCIAEEYSKLRSQENSQSDIARTSPVTARSLETLIRLATAHAKARLSKVITEQDAEAAIELVQFAYFKKVMEKAKKRSRNGDSDSEEEAPKEGKRRRKHSQPKSPGPHKERRPRKQPGEEGYDPYDFDSDSSGGDDTQGLQQMTVTGTTDAQSTADGSVAMETEESQPKAKALDQSRLKQFKASLLKLFSTEHAQSMPLPQIIAHLNQEHAAQQFTTDDVDAAIEAMSDANQIMLADGIVFLI